MEAGKRTHREEEECMDGVFYEEEEEMHVEAEEEAVSTRASTEMAPFGTMTVGCSEALIEVVEDGETKVVHTASRYLDEMIRARKGYLTPEKAIAEGRAMKEILLAKEGIPIDDDDLSKGLRFPVWSDDDDIRKVVEYKQVGVYVRRDIDQEPAPGDETKSDTLGRYAPGDYICFDRTRDIHFVLSDESPFPLDITEVECTLRDKAQRIEQYLIGYPLTCLPVYTPKLLPLLCEGVEWPVVIDSFTVFRYYIVLKRILTSRWKFKYDSDLSYLDKDLEAKVRDWVFTKKDWVPALPAPEIMSALIHTPVSTHTIPLEEEEEMIQEQGVDKTPLTGKLPTTLEQWWYSLPEWFRNATSTGIHVEEWALRMFNARLKGKGAHKRAVVPTEDELEGIMAEWATQQHQIRSNYLTLSLGDYSDERLQYYKIDKGDDGAVASAASNVAFLKDFLVISRDATAQFLRNNETLMLRMMARHIPSDQWEWFMSEPKKTPLFDGRGMVTEEEFIKQQAYRGQLRTLRLRIMSGYVPPVDSTDSIVPRGPTYGDMGAMWAWYNLHIPSEDSFNRMQLLMADLMPTIERLKKRVEDYVPNPDILVPLIEKLDIQGVPNSMRDSFLRSENVRDEDTGSFSDSMGSRISGVEERSREEAPHPTAKKERVDPPEG